MTGMRVDVFLGDLIGRNALFRLEQPSFVKLGAHLGHELRGDREEGREEEVKSREDDVRDDGEPEKVAEES